LHLPDADVNNQYPDMKVTAATQPVRLRGCVAAVTLILSLLLSLMYRVETEDNYFRYTDRCVCVIPTPNRYQQYQSITSTWR